jgi:hypothetical protein
MAQHIIIDVNKAPKIKKSIERVTQYLAKDWNRAMLEREACMKRWLPIYQKEVYPFSRAYSKESCEWNKINYDDHFYVTIRKYDLRSFFPDEKLLGEELKASWVEVLADKRGSIVRCFVAV